MSDFAQPEPVVTPTFVNTYMPSSPVIWLSLKRDNVMTSAVITWVANVAIFVPVTLPWPYPVRRVFWVNGSTLTTSNADFGIYNYEGTKLYSTGSVALSGATAPQYTDVTDFVLPAGRYYFAYACNNTTSRSHGSTAHTTLLARQSGILQQGTALPLPATMASAVASTNSLLPMCGITRTASGF